MKLLVGRILLGCLLAVLVLAEEPVTDNVETAKAVAVPVVDVPTAAEPTAVESAVSTDTVVVTSAPEPLKSKIFASEESRPTYETYSKPQAYFPKPTNDGHHHHHHDIDNFDDHHHHHHHAPPPQHPPPHSHNHYPGYYPPQHYYPAPYPYSAPVYAPMPPPPMPYPYPYPQQHPPQPPSYYPTHVKPVTVIQTVPVDSDDSGSSGHKPGDLIHHGTGYLWNLFDQKNTELWNLFGNKHGGNNGDKGDTDTIHEVVVTYQDPPTGTIIKPGKPSYLHGHNDGGGNWYIKGKNAAVKDCDHDH